MISRFTNDPDEQPESLYLFRGSLYPTAEAESWSSPLPSIVVSSERLTADAGWTEVPANHMVVIRAGEAPVLRPIPTRWARASC